MKSEQKIGGYRILSPLGAGGMGEVWRAQDEKLGREVALKVLPAEFAGDQDRMARFEREAKVLASLNHPNIATLFGLESVTSGVDADADSDADSDGDADTGTSLCDDVDCGAASDDECDGDTLRPPRFGDVAILLRRRRFLPAYEQALRSAGVPIEPAGRGMLAASRDDDLFYYYLRGQSPGG